VLNNKLVIDGYVMVQQKVHENRYNWECAKRVHRKTLATTENCNARTTTECVNGVHIHFVTRLQIMTMYPKHTGQQL